MTNLISNASLISFYPPILIASTLFIFFLGFIYGYGISFIIEFKKVFSVGFFVVLLSSIIIFSITGAHLVSVQCKAPDGTNLCNGTLGTLGPAAATLMLLLSNLIINLFIGHVGLSIGLVFYMPSAWIIARFFDISSIKKTTSEYDIINSSANEVTFGIKSIINK